MDFVNDEGNIIDGIFEGNSEREVGSDVSMEYCEEKCLIQGIFNAYKAYEAGIYQV